MSFAHIWYANFISAYLQGACASTQEVFWGVTEVNNHPYRESWRVSQEVISTCREHAHRKLCFFFKLYFQVFYIYVTQEDNCISVLFLVLWILCKLISMILLYAIPFCFKKLLLHVHTQCITQKFCCYIFIYLFAKIKIYHMSIHCVNISYKLIYSFKKFCYSNETIHADFKLYSHLKLCNTGWHFSLQKIIFFHSSKKN